ncbi:MAG: hypothetical protein QXU99_07185 [Candidatus Bathyarchaeia archaeon]
MTRKINTTAIFIIVLCAVGLVALVLTRPSPEQNQEETVKAGVTVGDTFTYSIKGIANLIDANASVPEAFYQLNMTEWYKVTITNVTSSEIFFNATWRFSNATESQRTGKVNFKTGIGNSQDFWAIYASGLKAGDYLRPYGADRVTINATESRSYRDGTRETNKVALETEFYDVDDPTYSRAYIDYLTFYFDRQTGILVELTDVKYYSSPQIILVVEWKLVDSNVWNVK